MKIYVTNLGKYNEGSLVGEWVELPTTREYIQEVFKRIGIGKQYEEWFITDYDCDISGLSQELGEYESLDELSYLATKIDNLDKYETRAYEAVIAMGEYSSNVQELINLTDNLDCFEFLDEIYSDKDLGYYYVEDIEIYDKTSMGTLANYIDYETLGRDIRLEQGGTFTDDGYVSSNYGNFCENYDGSREDIPEEYRITYTLNENRKED